MRVTFEREGEAFESLGGAKNEGRKIEGKKNSTAQAKAGINIPSTPAVKKMHEPRPKHEPTG